MKTSIILGLLSITCAVAGEEIGATGVWVVGRKVNDEPLRTGMVWPKSPADKAGITSGCFLISVDGTNVVTMSATNAMNMIRGPVGKVVTLEIADATRSKTNKFAVKRGRAVIRDNRVVEITE
jgi:C-terminal processing protease CtpA/Prc